MFRLDSRIRGNDKNTLLKKHFPFHVSRFTFHFSLFTFHKVLRFTFHFSRFTKLSVSPFTFHVSLKKKTRSQRGLWERENEEFPLRFFYPSGIRFLFFLTHCSNVISSGFNLRLSSRLRFPQ